MASQSTVSSDSAMVVIHEEEAALPPIVSSYNSRIRPLLDCIDKLRNLQITQEGIQLPTIVVVGDQSSGKSSVLESLAGISLPRGQGICTRVPLIMRLQAHPDPTPELFLEYDGQIVPTDEDNVADDINQATDAIAGTSKGISNRPLTLVVKKNGVPDLTMVDLPGITRVAVHGQPANIYEQISHIIMEYITPEESIILNVLSAAQDFSTCESISMSQKVDKTGERTLAVVTKTDTHPDGLLEKVTANDVNIGLGYVCVRNRIGNESYEEARAEEAMLYENHHLLSKINKTMVGIPVLAQRLVHIQAGIISKCLPNIVKKINERLASNVAEIEKLPGQLTSPAQAVAAFMRIISQSKESLKKLFLTGEFEEYPDEKHMHSRARLAEMISEYDYELQVKSSENDTRENFLREEISILEESKGIGLPNFLPRTAFLALLRNKVNSISSTPVEFVTRVWDYVATILIPVLMKHSDHYPQMQPSIRRAAQDLIEKKKELSVKWISEIIEQERMTDYTCNPEYVAKWTELMKKQQTFMEKINSNPSYNNIMLTIEGYGNIDVEPLRKYRADSQQAFDLKMRMTAYWKLVLRRLVDSMALHLLYSIQKVVNADMEGGTVNELMGQDGGGIERMLEESPMVAEKRFRLTRSIKLLNDSKEVVSKIIDKVSGYSD